MPVGVSPAGTDRTSAYLQGNTPMRGSAPYWMALAIVTLTRVALADPPALPAPQPIERIGACPARYLPNGRYCLPNPNAAFVILKRGLCPSGYLPQGAYCLANRNARLAIPRLQTVCPSGWLPQGEYCLANR